MHWRDCELWIATNNLQTYGWDLYRGETELANFEENHTQVRSATARITTKCLNLQQAPDREEIWP